MDVHYIRMKKPEATLRLSTFSSGTFSRTLKRGGDLPKLEALDWKVFILSKEKGVSEFGRLNAPLGERSRKG
jgi:hypothetical protein